MVELPEIESESRLEGIICSWIFRALLLLFALAVIYIGMTNIQGNISIGFSKDFIIILGKAWDTGWGIIGSYIAGLLRLKSTADVFIISTIVRNIYQSLVFYSFLRPLFTWEYLEDLAHYLIFVLAFIGMAFLIMYLIGIIVIKW